jgi:hypothetical protein
MPSRSDLWVPPPSHGAVMRALAATGVAMASVVAVYGLGSPQHPRLRYDTVSSPGGACQLIRAEPLLLLRP